MTAAPPLSESVAEGPRFQRELLDLLRQGKKIEAIKAYREQTGAGLKEAKDAVEAFAARHNIALGRAGCAGMLALVTAGLALVIAWMR